MPLLAILLAGALAVETPPAPAAPAAAPSGKDMNKVVCRGGVHQVGSRMRQRPICMTRREWEERARQDKELMDAIQKGSVANTRRPGTPQ